MNRQNELQCFCENIRHIRKANGLSCRVMATKLQIGIGSLRKIEQGILPPRLGCEVLLAIYREFHIYPGKMFSPIQESAIEKNQKKQKNS